MDRELTTTSTEIVSVVADDGDEAEEEEEEKTTEQPTSSAQCHVYLDKLESCLDRHCEEGGKDSTESIIFILISYRSKSTAKKKQKTDMFKYSKCND